MRTVITALTLWAVCGFMMSGCDRAEKANNAAGESDQSVGGDAASAGYAANRGSAAAAEASLAAEAASKEASQAAH
jgi:hypothetical protein